MSNYRRHYIAGGSYFFTVNLYNRKQTLLTDHIDLLRDSVRKVKKKYPFEIVAWVVLPDHMHCIWTLPQGCSDFSIRWRLIKLQFSKGVAMSASSTVNHRRERHIWQRRFWEHTLRDADDIQKHVEYIHYNPVKHGYVANVQEWPYSSIHWH
ncbi:MAG: REP-associated tyrosine transposase [Pseudomonadota bacterium]